MKLLSREMMRMDGQLLEVLQNERLSLSLGSKLRRTTADLELSLETLTNLT